MLLLLLLLLFSICWINNAIFLFIIHIPFIRSRIAILNFGVEMICMWAWFSGEGGFKWETVRFTVTTDGLILCLWKNGFVLYFLCLVSLVSFISYGCLVDLVSLVSLVIWLEPSMILKFTLYLSIEKISLNSIFQCMVAWIKKGQPPSWHLICMSQQFFFWMPSLEIAFEAEGLE